MDLWWRLRGWNRLRLTSADCTARLREISGEIRIEDVRFESDLTVSFSTVQTDVKRIILRDGETLEIIGSWGVPVILRMFTRWKLMTATALILCVLTLFFRGRILFLRVEGNGDIPARLILEHAGECGVSFGAQAKAVRSEGVKNHLLWAIPELRWAGVNVHGCTATITVEPRQEGADMEPPVPGDIVAAMDAVVTEAYPVTGTLKVKVGQAVRRGEVLIGGGADLGLLVRVDRARGEVYGLTRRTVTVVLPEKTMIRIDPGRSIKKYSLRFGKKSVNFRNDSGIFHGTCVKMRTVDYIKLPGGLELPAALVTENRRLYTTRMVSRKNDAPQLLEAARRYVREQMTAGTILREETTIDGRALTVVFECRELIGVFRPGTMTEGDSNDRENGERRTG